jgi:hypothetical protein
MSSVPIGTHTCDCVQRTQFCVIATRELLIRFHSACSVPSLESSNSSNVVDWGYQRAWLYSVCKLTRETKAWGSLITIYSKGHN